VYHDVYKCNYKKKMQQSMDHADIRNKQRCDQDIRDDEVMAELLDNPVEITEDDMELINDFLNA